MPEDKEKQPFYKTNSEILKLDPITDHYKKLAKALEIPVEELIKESEV